jgi:ankyrin repeat protein
MHWAAKRGDVDILRYLHEKGAKTNIPATTDANLLPIHWAAAEGQVSAVGFFIDIGQDINIQDNNGCSPSVIAVQFNQVDALIYLAKHGADLTLVDHNGDHCLHWAAYKGFDELIELVLYFIPQELNKCDTFGQVRAVVSSQQSLIE